MYLNKAGAYIDSDDNSEVVDEQEDLFRRKVQTLWQEECFVDVTLATDGKLLNAHKLVLSAYSDYFKEIFSSIRSSQYPVVFMKDISSDVLEAILQFMYCGEVNVSQYNLNDFMRTANILKIKGINITEDQFEYPVGTNSQYDVKSHIPHPQLYKHSGKRKQNMMAENISTSPNLKKKRPKTQYESMHYQPLLPSQQNFGEEDDDQDYDDNEMEPMRQQVNLKGRKMHHSIPAPGMIENAKHKRRSSVDRSSHSSQHSRSSISRSSEKKKYAYIQKQEAVEGLAMRVQESMSDPHHQEGQSDASSTDSGEMETDETSQRLNSTKSAEFSSYNPNKRDIMQGMVTTPSVIHKSQTETRQTQGGKCQSQAGMQQPQTKLNQSQMGLQHPRNQPPMIVNQPQENMNKSQIGMQQPETFQSPATSSKQSEVHSKGRLSNVVKARLSQGQDEDANMDPENELRLIKFVDYMSQIAPLTCNQVRLFAWGIDTVLGSMNFGPDGPSKNWWNSFRVKHPRINKVLRSYDFLKASHLKNDSFFLKAMSDYLIPIQEIIEAFDLNNKPENFWSCSEYTINVTGMQDNCLRPGRERFFSDTHFPENGDFISIMLAGSASGKKMSPFAVFKDSAPGSEFTSNGPASSVYAHNSTGFMDSSLTMNWFKNVFLPQCPKNRSEDEPVVLLLNSIFPLVPSEMLDLALAENVIILSLMPHLHKACQPMDISFVKGFRKGFIENLRREKISGDPVKELLPMLIKNPFESMTSNMIKEGFRMCGIFPLSATMNHEEHFELQMELGFCSNQDKLNINQNRKPKTPHHHEEDPRMNDEGSRAPRSCYVCGKEFPAGGNLLKCTNRFCTNFSCSECLPMNCDKNTYICIDCSH